MTTLLHERLQECMARITRMQELATNVPAIDYVDDVGGRWPIWMNVFGGHVRDNTASGQYTYTFTIGMRLVIGSVTSGYDGQVQRAAMYDYLPKAIAYFEEHKSLVYEDGQRSPDGLSIRGVVVGQSTGFSVFGADTQLLGFELPLALPIFVTLDTRY